MRYLVKALMTGLTGGYCAIVLMVTVGALSKTDHPQAMTEFLNSAKSMPGAARLRHTLIDTGAWPSEGVLSPPQVEMTRLQRVPQAPDAPD